MRMIDPHLHTDKIEPPDLLKVSIAGVEAAVLPTPHALPWLISGETLLRMWRSYLDFQVEHAKSLGIALWVTLGVPFYGVDTEGVKECLEQLPRYLDNKHVVGLGEIGLDAGIEDEVKLFRTQLNIAKECNLPIIVHTPTPMEPQAIPVLKQIINVIREENFPFERAVLDHSAINTVKTRLDSGAMVGLSVCFDKLRPEDAAETVLQNPARRDRFLINSEVGDSGVGYFSIPRTVLAMRRLGLRSEEIERVTWDNPKRFFDLPIE